MCTMLNGAAPPPPSGRCSLQGACEKGQRGCEGAGREGIVWILLCTKLFWKSLQSTLPSQSLIHAFSHPWALSTEFLWCLPWTGVGGWVMQAVRMHVLDCSVLWDSEELWVSCAMLSFQVGWSRGCVQCTAGLVPSSHQDTSWQDMVTSAPFAPTSPPEQPTRQVGNAPSQMHSAFFQLLGHFSSCDWSVLWSHNTAEQEGSQHLLVSHFLFKMLKFCLDKVRPCGEREYVEGKGWQGEERNPYIPEAPLTWK